MKSRFNKIKVVVVVEAIIVLAVIGTLYATKSGPFEPPVQTDTKEKQEVAKPDVETVLQPTSDAKAIAQSNEGSLSTPITKLEVNETALMVRSETAGSVDGKCILKLIHRGQPVVQEASTQVAADVTICSVDVPHAQLTDSNYEVILIVEANDQKSVTKTQLSL